MVAVTEKKEGSSQGWVAAAIVEAKKRQSSNPALTHYADLFRDAESVWNKVLFPTPRLENWKYTNTEEIAKGAFALATQQATAISPKDLEAMLPAGLQAHNLVFVDGIFAPALSAKGSPTGARITRLAESADGNVGSLAPHKEDAFAALATTLLCDGVSISVERSKVVTTPIHIVHIATGASAYRVVTPRLFVDAGEASQVTIIESYLSTGTGKYLSMPVAEILAHDGALVDYYKCQLEDVQASHVSNLCVSQARSGSVSVHIFSFGGGLVRNNATTSLKGSGATTTLNGLSVLSGTQHVDNSTVIHHIEPTIESREHFKGIYADSSRGVFSGTIIVDQIAQKTNAFQSNQALLLSPKASIETRPQLKIWADDVKCTHGATVGQLDEEAMFYLRSRGIGKEDARNFLVHAFASEVVTGVRVPALKEYVEAQITKKLGA